MRKLILIYSIFSLIGCTSFNSSVPVTYKSRDYFYLSSDWLNQNEQEIALRLTKAIRQKHPNTADWFPRVKIQSIDIEVEPNEWRKPKELRASLNRIFTSVSSDLFPESNSSSAWTVDLKIRTASKEMNKGLYALMVPYGVACFYTLMMVCPVTDKAIVVVDSKFNTTEQDVFSFSGAGASRLVAISPYAGDGPQWGDEAQIKALIAALSQIADKLVTHVEANGV